MKVYITTILLLFLSLPVYCQKNKIDFGKVDKSELLKNPGGVASNAPAIILSEKVITYYKYTTNEHNKYITNDFKVCSDHYVKIKILNPEGLDYANITLPYYVGKSTADPAERILELKANSYTLKNGDIVKAEMDKKQISDERTSTYQRMIRFSVPDVETGSIIEYQYRKESDLYHYLPDVSMQSEIPIQKGYYEVRIPTIFDFNISYKNNLPVKIKESFVNDKFKIYNRENQTHTRFLKSRKITFETQNIPALQKEPYSWCKNDFKLSATFELRGTEIPGSKYRPFTSTWDKVDEELLEHAEFGKLLKFENLYRDELLSSDFHLIHTKRERIEFAFKFLKSKIQWNGEYRLYANELRKVARKGSGNNAEMNFILIGLLRDMGIKAYPVVLNRRESGRLPLIFPTISKFNTFVLAIESDAGEILYLDSSMDIRNLYVFKTDFMVENARLIKPDGKCEWIDLTSTGTHEISAFIKAELNDEGIISGEKVTKLKGQFAAEYRDKYMTNFKETNNSLEDNFKIEKFENIGLDIPTEEIEEKYLFQQNINSDNEYIYLNPMIISHITTNPFTESKRQNPIEMDYFYQFTLTSFIKIPDNYEVVEMPKLARFNFEQNYIECAYSINNLDGVIHLNYVFRMNQLYFPENLYNELTAYYDAVIDKNNEYVVLKKKE